MMPTERNEPMLDLIHQVTTGIADAQLLRNLAEDVPDMALEIRNQLRKIAASLDAAKAERLSRRRLRDERLGWAAALLLRRGGDCECTSTNPTMSIPVRRESPAPSASDPTAPATWVSPHPLRDVDRPDYQAPAPPESGIVDEIDEEIGDCLQGAPRYPHLMAELLQRARDELIRLQGIVDDYSRTKG